MQLKQKRGQLSYGSAYKLFYFGWVLGWGILMAPILLIIVLSTAFSGTFMMNGEELTGVEAVLSMLGFTAMFPLIVALQGLMGAGLMTLGLWVYRRFRPITLAGSEEVF